MNTSLLLPTAPTTLVIVLGASAWPNSPGFQPSEAFVHAAQGFREYLLDLHGLGLPPMNLLDLFDAQTSASDQLETLGSFLEERIQTRKGTNQAVRDVLIYFVGHGGFAGPAADFYLLHRRANASSLRATGIAIDALAEVVREKARQTRRYLFLDCCFAAAAFRSFQAGPDQVAITKALDAFHVQARSRGFPQKGTVLLCSSNHKTPSQLLPDESSTMFSFALLDVLKNGDRSRPLQLSLRDLKELVEDRLARLPEQNAPRPGLYSPDQSDGDVADVPFFSNPRANEEEQRKRDDEKRRRAEEERIQQALREAQARKAAEEERIRRLEEEARAFQSKQQLSSPTEAVRSQEDGTAWSVDQSPPASDARALLERSSSAPSESLVLSSVSGSFPMRSQAVASRTSLSRWLSLSGRSLILGGAFRLFAYVFPLLGFFYIPGGFSVVATYLPLFSIHLLVFWIAMLFFLLGLPGLQQAQISHPVWLLRLFPGLANSHAASFFSGVPALERPGKPSGWLGSVGMGMLMIAGFGSLVLGLGAAFTITGEQAPLIFVDHRFIPDVGSPFINGYRVAFSFYDWDAGKVVGMVLLSFSVIGGLLWGIAIVKESAFPRWTGIVFAIGSVLTIVSFVLGNGLFELTGDGVFGSDALWHGFNFTLSLLITVLLSTSMIRWGYALIKSQRDSPARVV